ncbi:MAG: UDP-N-acetylmuramoyl-L-alanine--D-glutamate ligase, partial [bacterium]|nr:UDP-N-acetylmuramoyl-L-alanine--D-glutamate ligase [bacterium]
GKAVQRHCRSVYLLLGDASEKQKRALGGMKNVSAGHNDLGVAVRNAFADARRGDVVLFSPAAASFNLWLHEFDRGDSFVSAVKSL